MSNAEREQEERELKEMETQLLQEKETKEQATAANEPHPEPVIENSPEAKPIEEATVTPKQSEDVNPTDDKPKDDAMEWAKRKGYKSSEDMARELRKKEQDYHRQQQEEAAKKAQQQPAWQPQPEMGNYGYQQPPVYQPPRISPRDVAPYYPQLNPEDVERVLPMVVDAAEAIANRKMAALQQQFGQQFGEIQRTTARNNELMSLMQDPAFRDERVQREIHAVLDADPSIFQRPGAYTAAFNQALANMTRKQLQQGIATESPTGLKPPVTAGGGNGSASTTQKVTERDFDRWTLKEQEAFINSNGRIVPKK